MAYASTSEFGHRKHSRLSTVFSECGAFFTLLGAAIRAGRAVEDQRQPDQRDLSILGVKGPIAGPR